MSEFSSHMQSKTVNFFVNAGLLARVILNQYSLHFLGGLETIWPFLFSDI